MPNAECTPGTPRDELCDGLDNDCDGTVDEGCEPAPPPVGPPNPDVCSENQSTVEANQGDPINLATGTSYVSETDAQLAGVLGPVNFTRSYTSDDSAWLHASALATVPKPFGSSPTDVDSLKWWHNYFSYVHATGATSNRWDVRLPGGRLVSFWGCANTDCWATPLPTNQSVKERLQKNANGYTVLEPGGRKLLFNSPWIPSGGSAANHHFLTIVRSPRGYDEATLGYLLPDVSCPAGAAVNAGVPYLRTIATPEATLQLSYAVRQNAGGATECVISQLGLVAGSTTTLATYGYPAAGGVGLLSSVSRPGSGIETYEYSATELVRRKASTEMMRHTYSSNAVTTASWRGANWSVSGSAATSCQAGSACCGTIPNSRTVTDNRSRAGDATNSLVALTSNYETLSNVNQHFEPRLYRQTDACGGSSACSPGTEQYEWTCSASGVPGYEKAKKDKRGNWTSYTRATPGGAAPKESLELTSVKRGASDMGGTGFLEEDRYEYVYGANQTQLMKAHIRDSVLGAAGEVVRTDYGYDLPKNFLMKEVTTGWTRRMDWGATYTWITEKRSAGVFYFRQRNGTGAVDPFDRVLEAHGPCYVADATATDCTGSEYPIVQYEYYAATDPQPQRNRLKKVSRLGTSGIWLDTTFESYNALGLPLVVKDPNNVQTTYTYLGELVASKAVQGIGTSVYTYDNGKLTAIQHPKGNYEVFCYRESSLVGGCSTSQPWSPQLQWRAKATSASGISWSERVEYSYWEDGTVQSETFTTPDETRKVLTHAADAHRRPTWEGVGNGAYASTFSFDGAGSRTGIGFAFNTPGGWCGGVDSSGRPLSKKCAALEYDAVNRLTLLDQYPTTTATGERTCFTYDRHGNVTSAKSGCAANAACSACTQPASTYANDDFGHVIETTLASAATEPTMYAYTAGGQVEFRQTPPLVTGTGIVRQSFDRMGRPLDLTRRWLQYGHPVTALVYSFYYDLPFSPATNCPAQSNQKGRLAFRKDSFGRTLYSYDNEGRVTAEIRLRGSDTTCGDPGYSNPHTLYDYDLNGNLEGITYPYGREVLYEYGSLNDRVTAVVVKLYDAAQQWAEHRLLTAIAWEPYGEIRGYQLNPPGGSTSALEYVQGNDGSIEPKNNCLTVAPVEENDLSGRLRSVWLSSGAFSLSGGAGDIYQKTYTWAADQVARTDSCLLGSSQQAEEFGYDQLLRLKTAQTSSSSLVYGYDARSNRTTLSEGLCNWTLTYGASPLVDHQTSQSSGCDALLSYTYDYTWDTGGRMARKDWVSVGGSPVYSESNTYGMDGLVATDSVFKSSCGNGCYNYYYDAYGRRTAKIYPGGTSDEFFYDLGHQMLTDQGNDVVYTPVAGHPVDDYVWLGGRPVLVVRGLFTSEFGERKPDSSSGDRNGETYTGGPYFIVTDHIARPVVMLDNTGKVAFAADYDPFGFPNRVTVQKGTAHPLPAGTAGTFAALTHSTGSGTALRMRALYHMVDSQNDVAGFDVSTLRDGVTNQVLYSVPQFYSWVTEGSTAGRVWSDWMTPTNTGGVVAVNAKWDSTAVSSRPRPVQGYTIESFEFQKYETGGSPFTIPLRFPGQYHDAETDLFENWNRYYDPSIGRYLQPEPMLGVRAAPSDVWLMNLFKGVPPEGGPSFVTDRAERGESTPVYAYAANNPVNFSDPTGLAPSLADCKMACAKSAGKKLDDCADSTTSASKCVKDARKDFDNCTHKCQRDDTKKPDKAPRVPSKGGACSARGPDSLARE